MASILRRITHMLKALPLSFQTGTLILSVIGTAVGLNLSVMAIGQESDPAPDQLAAVPDDEGSGDPEVMQVTVDVPVSTAEASTEAIAVLAPATQAPAAQYQPVPVAAAPWPTSPPAPTAAPTSPPTVAPTTPPPTTPDPTQPPPTFPPTEAPTTPPPTEPADDDEPADDEEPVVTSAPAPVTEYLSYSFDGVAGIVVAFHGGEELEFWSVSPEAGWGYVVEKNRPSVVEIKFRRTSGPEGEAKFELSLEDGKLDVNKER
jgi:hypothetical protein